MNTVTIWKENYPTKYQYYKAIKAAKREYDFHTRCTGGMLFFRHAQDYTRWLNQK